MDGLGTICYERGGVTIVTSTSSEQIEAVQALEKACVLYQDGYTIYHRYGGISTSLAESAC